MVQISDVHCGQMFRKETLRAAVREINEIGPDIILVTGDLTENGLITEFQTAARELKKLKVPRMVYISGNRDYRSTGYLLFEILPFLANN